MVRVRVGSNILALTEHGARSDDPVPPIGALSLQLAFRVAPSEVAACATVHVDRGVKIISRPTDQPFGHRILFFRDPDGNLWEMYAEIEQPFALWPAPTKQRHTCPLAEASALPVIRYFINGRMVSLTTLPHVPVQRPVGPITQRLGNFHWFPKMQKALTCTLANFLALTDWRVTSSVHVRAYS